MVQEYIFILYLQHNMNLIRLLAEKPYLSKCTSKGGATEYNMGEQQYYHNVLNIDKQVYF